MGKFPFISIFKLSCPGNVLWTLVCALSSAVHQDSLVAGRFCGRAAVTSAPWHGCCTLLFPGAQQLGLNLAAEVRFLLYYCRLRSDVPDVHSSYGVLMLGCSHGFQGLPLYLLYAVDRRKNTQPTCCRHTLVDPKRKGCSRKRCFFSLVYHEFTLFGDRVKLHVKHLAFRGSWCVLNCPAKAEGQISSHPWRCSCWREPERIPLVQILVVVANFRMKIWTADPGE